MQLLMKAACTGSVSNENLPAGSQVRNCDDLISYTCSGLFFYYFYGNSPAKRLINHTISFGEFHQ